MISFQVTSSAVPAIRGFIREMNKAVNDALEVQAIVTQIDAQQHHRFKNRTYNLFKQTKFKVRRRDNAINFYIDDQKAVYGKFIHHGFKSWAPDPYLRRAVMRNMGKTTTAVNRAIDRVIQRNGLA